VRSGSVQELNALMQDAGLLSPSISKETGVMLRKVVRHYRGVLSAIDEWLDAKKVPK
jgi:hypothetical protein